MDTAIEQEMKRRIRRHMLTSIGGVILALVLVAVGGGVLGVVFGGAPPAWAGGVVGLVAFVTIPAVGFGSTFHNLRCPSCNGLVAFQVSVQYSAFGGLASKTCRHCGVQIFANDTPRRVRRMLLLVVVAGILLGASGAVVSMMSRRHHAPTPDTTAPAP